MGKIEDIFGLVLKDIKQGPLVSALASGDQVRARNIRVLSQEPDFVAAFDAAAMHFVKICTAIPDTPLGRLSLSAFEQVNRGFDAVISEDERSVMNSCRILMELTAIVTEWRFDPERMGGLARS